MPTPKRFLRDLYTLFASIRTEKEVEMLLTDMLTPKEIESLARRWQLVQMLSKKIPQRTIVKRLPVSISKVTRGSHVLQEGTGGVRYFLKKLGKK